MYSIIYWQMTRYGDTLKPFTDTNGLLNTYKTLKEADKKANEIEKMSSLPLNDDGVGKIQKECRVITIDAVME